MSQTLPVSRFIGRALMALARISAVILSLVLLSLPLQGDQWPEFHQGSSYVFVDALLQPWVAVVLAATMISYLVVRFKFIPKPRTRMTDLVYLTIVVVLLGGFQAVAYLPVFNTQAL